MRTAALAFLLALCAAPVLAADPDAKYPSFKDPNLKAGRAIWLGTCKACHATGIADAPRVDDREAWKPRLAKDRATLYQHALNGFFGPMGTMMPPRGGNDKLSDAEVKSAVDYMVSIVKK